MPPTLLGSPHPPSVVMARTSRNGAPAASVDALDNLNLDDMFADEGDALFDGLDIDLGNMDDIAESSAAAAAAAAAAGGGTLKTSALSSPSHPLSPASAAPHEESDIMGSAKRRSTKRKIKSPMFFADKDDDYVDEPKKKKKKAPTKVPPAPKAGPAKKKGSAKNAAVTSDSATAAIATATVVAVLPAQKAAAAGVGADGRKTKGGTGKGKKTTARSLSMPPPAGRAGQAVAAAGQFGGRQKRVGASFSVPANSKNKALQGKTVAGSTVTSSMAAVPNTAAGDSSKAPAQRSQSMSAAISIAQLQASHPGLTQSPFCGLLPSNTLFYPFMPALPAEPSFKHRKIFPMIDRIHTSFMSYLTSTAPPAGTLPSLDTEAIFQLMQDAFRDEKSTAGTQATDPTAGAERHKSIGNAIGALRRSIGVFEKNRLVVDLLAVCALLKRQYDFLKQNMSNMEQWCKNHFPEAEYAAVYEEPKASDQDAEDGKAAPPTLLSTFKIAELKVKVICTSFKEPKSQLIATLPAAILIPHTPAAIAAIDSGVAKSTTKSKKRKLGSATPAPSSVKTTAVKPSEGAVFVPAELTYSEMNPSKRRKCVSDMISRSARELESKYLLRFEEQRQLLNRQQRDVLQLVEDDPVHGIHTLGMWKWLERSGYFERITDGEVQWRLDGSIVRDAKNKIAEQSASILPFNSREPDRDVMAYRLQSLLVIDDQEESADESDCDDLESLTVSPVRSLSPINGATRSTDAGFSQALNSLGLSRIFLSQFPDFAESRLDVCIVSESDKKSGDELGDVIHSMVSDFRELNDLNSKRTAFVESVACAHQLGEDAGKKAEDSSMIARCQQLLRKSKELKGKNGKMKSAKKDEYALPW